MVVEISNPKQEALKEFMAEEKLAKEGMDAEYIETAKEKPEEQEEESEEDKGKQEEESEESEEEESKEDQEEETEESEEDITARAEKAKNLGLKEDATDEDIKAAEDTVQKEVFEKEVKELAETENVTIDQARKHLESVEGILNKYENNPKKLAAAYRNSQAEFSKIQAENAQLKVAKPKVITLGEGEFAVGDRVFSKEKVIDNYRKLHPVETEYLEDPQVFLMAKTAFEAEVTTAYSEYERKLSVKASAKKVDLISNLGEQDKKFAAEIKEILDVYADDQVVKDDFDIRYIARVVKGEKYEELQKTHKESLKAEYERGLKAGREGARIKIPGGTPPKGKGKASLNESEKSQALRMYGSAMTEDEAYEAFKEVGLKEFREENKK